MVTMGFTRFLMVENTHFLPLETGFIFSEESPPSSHPAACGDGSQSRCHGELKHMVLQCGAPQ